MAIFRRQQWFSRTKRLHCRRRFHFTTRPFHRTASYNRTHLTDTVDGRGRLFFRISPTLILYKCIYTYTCVYTYKLHCLSVGVFSSIIESGYNTNNDLPVVRTRGLFGICETLRNPCGREGKCRRCATRRHPCYCITPCSLSSPPPVSSRKRVCPSADSCGFCATILPYTDVHPATT